MRVDWSGNPEHLQAVQEKLGGVFQCSPTYWLAVVGDEGELLSVMVYHNFGPASCEITCVVFQVAPFSRKVLRDLFAYPFYQLGLRSVHSIVEISNSRSLDLTRRLGLAPAGLLRNWYENGSDGILHQMLKEECKWLT